jgi:hypothetical protein
MPFEKVEFSFPEVDDEEETNDIEVEESSALPVNTPNKSQQEPKPEPEPELEPELGEELEVEIINDTPEVDRDRTASEPPEDVTNEELEDYSDKVRKRIKHFSKGYHDERRAKEQAVRDREELEKYAQQLVIENKNLKTTQTKNQQVLLDQAKRTTSGELAAAKREYKDAYEAGDPDAVIDAQEKLTTINIKTDRLNNIQLPPLQNDKGVVEEVSTQPAPVPVDDRANEWAAANSWFGSDDEMTSYVLGLHSKLVKTGVNPQSDKYYETINARMRQMFPEEFEEETRPKRQANVVAPATRSTSPKKVRLTQTQVNLAKRLGVPLEDYAKQVAIEMRKNANG